MSRSDELQFAAHVVRLGPIRGYVFAQRTRVTVGSDAKVAIGSQRLALEVAPGTKVIRCHHPNGDITVLKNPPEHNTMPTLLLSTRLC
jgi:hypothetical protein